MRRSLLIVSVPLMFLITALLQPGVGWSADNPRPHSPVVDSLRSVTLRALTPDEIITCERVRQMQIRQMPFRMFDARGKNVYDFSHIEGATMPVDDEFFERLEMSKRQVISVPPDPDEYLERYTAKIPRETRIVTYCDPGCQSSVILMLKLKVLGFKNVKVMLEGFKTWQQKGYPATVGTPHLESGLTAKMSAAAPKK